MDGCECKQIRFVIYSSREPWNVMNPMHFPHLNSIIPLFAHSFYFHHLTHLLYTTSTLTSLYLSDLFALIHSAMFFFLFYKSHESFTWWCNSDLAKSPETYQQGRPVTSNILTGITNFHLQNHVPSIRLRTKTEDLFAFSLITQDFNFFLIQCLYITLNILSNLHSFNHMKNNCNNSSFVPKIIQHNFRPMALMFCFYLLEVSFRKLSNFLFTSQPSLSQRFR